jgi:hypothetical protein
LHYRYRETYYRISLVNVGGQWNGSPTVVLDGVEQPNPFILLQGDRREHTVEVRFG